MEIADLIEGIRRAERTVYFWHAAQLRDLKTYLRYGRIVTRQELFREGRDHYTPFDSDTDDVEWGIDDLTFGNLEDQGLASKNGRGIPNVYGPIALRFPPAAFNNGGFVNADVARSGQWSGTERNREVIETAEALTAACDGPTAKPEVGLHGGTLELRDANMVIVNPVVVDGARLVDIVRGLFANVRRRDGSRMPVVERNMSDEGRAIYLELVDWALDAGNHRGREQSLPATLRTWFDGLTGRSKFGNLSRFARYLDAGTLSAMRVEVVEYLFDDDYDDFIEYEQQQYDASEYEDDEERDAYYRDMEIEARADNNYYVDGLPAGEEEALLAEDDLEYGQGSRHRLHSYFGEASIDEDG